MSPSYSANTVQYLSSAFSVTSTMEYDIELTGEVVLLRPYCPEDAEPIYHAVKESVHELSPWMPWYHSGYSLKDVKQWAETRPTAWENGENYDFVILDKWDLAHLGGCGLNNIDRQNRFANLGYWVRTSKTGRGIATDAALLVVRFGFERLNLNRIEIVAAEHNKPSQRVAERLGATRECLLRKRLVVRDNTYDAVMFSLVREDT